MIYLNIHSYESQKMSYLLLCKFSKNFYITPLSASNFSISCCNSFAFSAATAAKSCPLEA